MKKAILLAFLILLCIEISYSQEWGCCTNPNAGAFSCTNERLVLRNECCPTPDLSFKGYYSNHTNAPNNSATCNLNFFFEGDECSAKDECSLGCCCSELGGVVKGKIQCQGDSTFYPNQFECNSLCPPPECIDGIDNDNNGCADFENGDTGCTSISDGSESGGICADTGPTCSSASYSPKITLNANPIKGEKKFFLSWTDECPKTSSYYEIFRCRGACTSSELIATLNSNTYTDTSELSFGVNYNYKIVAYYTISKQASANISANLGDEQCLGKLTDGVFCSNNSAYSCNSLNKMSAAGTRCSQSQICVVNQNKASCANKSLCNYNNANPFGMFYVQDSCENGRFCFYDRSHTIANSCFSCSEKMSCYDYKSKGTCERNNCNAGSCSWKDTQSGGVCANENEYNCKWCSQRGTSSLENSKAYNEIFDGCTKTKSQALSMPGLDCFYKSGNSKNCNEVICKDYDSDEDCSDAQIVISQSNSVTNPSQDQCKIGVCQKIGGSCVKNADGNREPDCDTDSCELDYYPPETTLQTVLTRGYPSAISLSIFDKSGPNGTKTLRTSTDYKTYLCANQCSTKDIFTTSRRLVVSGLSMYDSSTGKKILTLTEGQNELQYYTIDPANNLEIIKTAKIEAHANTSRPIIRMVNVTGGNQVGQRLYTANTKPSVLVIFFEPVKITYARLTSPTGFGFNLDVTPGVGPEYFENHILTVPTTLADGNYILEINARSPNNILMDKQGRFEITIDSISPAVTFSPKSGDTMNVSSFNIQLDFSEEVSLERARLNTNDILLKFSSLDGKRHISQINATDGTKSFSMAASDFAGNKIAREISFTVDANPTNISLLSPRYGVAPNNTFDVLIGTDNEAMCRYSFDTEFEYDFMERFNSSGTSHIMRNFNKINDARAHKLYVKCKDARNRESSKEFELSVDTSAPVLKNAFAYPNPVVESPGYTKLTIESDEPVICKYSQATAEFKAMQFKFGGFDESDFRTTNFQNVTLPIEGKFEFSIACQNRAGLVSSSKNVEVEVNFSTEVTVTSKTQEYFNSTSIALIVETNKRSQCQYSETDNTARLGNIFGSASYMHRKDLIVTQGNHVFYVVCRDSFLSIYSNVIPVAFTVDTTPPVMEYVDDMTTLSANREKSCFLDRLRVKMQASDNESRVKEYFYSLTRRSDSEVIVENARTTTGGDWIQVRSLNLSNNTEYYFSAKSKNYLNFESTMLSSDGVTVDTSACQSLTNLSCQDRGDCTIGIRCDSNSECQSDYCLNNLCRQATCADGIKNQQEPAPDCGGPCTKCNNGKECTSNNDCISGNCNFGTCKEQDLCFDSQLTPGESDVDCAGPCLIKCQEGKNCDSESSCESGLDCVSSRCTRRIEPEEQKPSPTDTDGDGIPDEWEIQNGLDPNDPSDSQDDTDNDGLTNEEEYQQQDVYGQSTDPNAQDTDGDGYSDLDEINAGTSPIDPEDFPKSSILSTLLFISGIVIMISGFGYLGYTMIQKKSHKDSYSPRQAPSFTPRQEIPMQRQMPSQKERSIIKRRDEEKEKERKELFDVFDNKVKDIDSGKAQPIEEQFEKSTETSSDKKQIQKKKVKSKEEVFSKLKEISKESKKARKKKS